MSVSVKDGTVLVHCQAACSQEDLIDALRGRGVWPERRNGHDEAERRQQQLEATWRECKADDGTVATYLRSRGLSGEVPSKLRLHRLLPYYNGAKEPESHHPAMVARVQALAGHGVNLHRTYLASGGHGKADVPAPKKLMRAVEDGATRGAAIRLSDPTNTLALSEGIETGLAVMEAISTPVWATANAGGMEAVELPTSVRSVEIWADHDANGAGQRAATVAAERFVSEGREVYVLVPKHPDTDWLDVLNAAGPDALREARAAAEPWHAGPSPNGAIVSSVSSVTADNDWPDPDPIFGPPAAPPLPLETLPDEIADVTRDVAERLQAPIDFVAWPLIVSTAALIGRGAGIRPRSFDDWTERPAVWCSLIGPPSWMKSPALEEGTRPLRRQAERDHEVFLRECEAWKLACIAARDADPKHPDLPPKPIERRCWTADVTVEKLAALLAPETSRGLAVYRDELAGLVLSMDKYHQRGGDRQFYLQGYTGGPYTVDRMSRESLFVPDLLLNVLGGIQPEVARAIFGGGPDDGFAVRFLSVWPDMPAQWRQVDRWPNRTARNALDAVNDRRASTEWASVLEHDDYRPTPYCRLDAEGQELFNEWHAATMVTLRSGSYQGRLEGRVGKYPGLVARLILVFHLTEWAAARRTEPRIVLAETVARVLDLVDEYLLPMERRVYAAYAVPPDAEGGRRIAGWLLAERPRPEHFTARDIRRHQWSGLQDPAPVNAALDWLVTHRWLREAELEKRPGRPPSAYVVNPRLGPTHG